MKYTKCLAKHPIKRRLNINMKKYTLNILNDVRSIDSNTVLLKTVEGRFQLKGDNISVAINDILDRKSVV